MTKRLASGTDEQPCRVAPWDTLRKRRCRQEKGASAGRLEQRPRPAQAPVSLLPFSWPPGGPHHPGWRDSGGAGLCVQWEDTRAESDAVRG